MRNVHRVHVTDIWSWYRVELRVGDHLGRSEELVSRCVECDLAEPESLASLGGSAPGVVDEILSQMLYACHKELEDTIKDLEGSTMELEIKSLDETRTKKELLENAVLKKKKDLCVKQKELAKTIQSIRCNKEGTPSAMNNSMPRFVNLAWNSEDDMDS